MMYPSYLRIVPLLLLVLPAIMQAADRVALVIGNNAYQNGSPLKNCVNDARTMAEGLKDCGFEVTLVEDCGLASMEEKLRTFKTAATGAKAAWFYYAGHGAEVRGSNYLIPVDATVKEEFEVKHKTLALDMVMGALEDSGAPLKVVVLDCCRDNPFGRGWSRNAAAGLAQVSDTPRGTIIAYATSPGKTAEDGRDGNSPYTKALVAALSKPGLDIDQVFKETGRGVLAATAEKQSPWMNTSYYGSFVLRPGPAIAPPGEAEEPSPFPKPDGGPAMDPAAAQEDYSYALGFKSGGEFKEQYGQFNVLPGDLDQGAFFDGLFAAVAGKALRYPEEKVKDALKVYGDFVKDRDAGSGLPGRETMRLVSHGMGFRCGGEFSNTFGSYGVGVDDLDKSQFQKGFMRAFSGQEPEKPEEKLKEAMEFLGNLLKEKDSKLAEKNLKQGAAFLKENAKRKGVVTTASGLQYEVLAKGGSRRYSAAEEKKVGDVNFMVRYRGNLIDGTEFDASPEGEAVPMTLSVIPGWVETLKMMPVGAEWKIYLPASLAYGDSRRSKEIGPNSAMIFEIELVDIKYIKAVEEEEE